MSQQPIRFDDGAAYERGMGVWSQIAGMEFLDWLAPAPGLRWVDIGCGNGAFTELLMRRCAPAMVHGIDPSAPQLQFASGRPGLQTVVFKEGDAMALPFDADQFDAAVMALVIFFVPDPAKGVSEMMRVVRPGGIVTAYAWDILGGGFPFEPIQAELRAAGYNPPLPPNAPVARMDALRALWVDAGLESVETHAITVERSFTDFEDYWDANTAMGSIKPALAKLPEAELATFKARLRARLPADAAGRITYPSRANAVTGRVPGA